METKALLGIIKDINFLKVVKDSFIKTEYGEIFTDNSGTCVSIIPSSKFNKVLEDRYPGKTICGLKIRHL